MMDSIIIICNDPRIGPVTELLQPLLTIRICIAPDFDTGLKEVFEKKPLAVFIQHEISGIKGETVIRHLTALLQTNSPQFIHLSPGHLVCGGDDEIDLNLPQDELVTQFRERLDRIPGVCLREIQAEVTSPSPSQLFLVAEEATCYCREACPSPQSKTTGNDDKSRLSENTSQPLPLGECSEEERPLPESAAINLKRSRIPLALILGVTVTLAGVIFFSLDNSAAPHQQSGAVSRLAPLPATSPPTATPVPARVTSREKCPSFIPKQGRDPTYGAARPGWERYLSPEREYRIFRSNGGIRALQLIALSQNALEPAFIAAVLRELCGDELYTINSRSHRGDYLIEQGETPSSADVTLYTKRESGKLHGIVISFP